MKAKKDQKRRGRPALNNVRAHVSFSPDNHRRIKEMSEEQTRDFSNMVNVVLAQFFEEKDATDA